MASQPAPQARSVKLIGKTRGQQLHVELGGRGHGREYDGVTTILGYCIDSLSDLVENEYGHVRTLLNILHADRVAA